MVSDLSLIAGCCQQNGLAYRQLDTTNPKQSNDNIDPSNETDGTIRTVDCVSFHGQWNMEC